MPNFTDLFVDRARDERRALAAQASIQSQGAQNIIADFQGSPELPGPVRGGGMGGIPAVQGIAQQPIQQQALSLGISLLGNTGFEQAGITQISLAIQNRSQMLNDNAQFYINQARLSGATGAKLTQDQEQFNDEFALKQAKSEADLKYLNATTLLKDAELKLLRADPTKTGEFMRRSALRSQALPTKQADDLLTFNQALLLQGNMINEFKPEFAINAITQTLGQLELFTLRAKTKPTIADQEKLLFWARAAQSEAITNQLLSGAEISDEQREEFRKFQPSVTDPAALLDSKMRQQFNNTKDNRALLRDLAIAEGRRDIGTPFKDFLTTEALAAPAAPVVPDPPPPPGF